MLLRRQGQAGPTTEPDETGSKKTAEVPEGSELHAITERGLTGHAPRFWPELAQLDCAFDISNGALWSFMDFDGRPSYNPSLLAEFHLWQSNIRALKAEHGDVFKYVILGSRYPGVFCLGGDLDYFCQCIAERDRDALYRYGRSCVEILHTNWRAIDSELITIGLVQGDALGGGFESLLSFDVIVAERGTKFGFPEQLFGLFPGMGALTFLGRKLGSAKSEWMVRTGRVLKAEEMFEMGIVHVLAEPGEGVEAVSKYMHKNGRRHAAHYRYGQAARKATPIPFEELDAVVSIWADSCMTLTDHDLQVMRRLVSAQSKLPAQAAG